MEDRIVRHDEVELYTESFGNPGDPAVLLIMGAQASHIWWEEAFCAKLADAGRFVIRYDNRDTGRSSGCEPGNPAYTFEDMADDAMHILDAYGIAQAHIVGISMGGLLTQILALRHPGRVLSVTLLATSNFAPDLPPMEEKVLAFFAQAADIDWANDEAVVEFGVDKWRVLAGSAHPFDEGRVRELAREEVKQSEDMARINNHGLLSGDESYLARTAEITAPALVIHGTEDPIIPLPHGERLADVIPGAALLRLPGTGHEVHPDDWETILGAIVRHTGQA
ncbi:alpha/beta fold hydrolase [Paenibacillus aurantiacus]|uniref:Alpha/beta fold hydrolase n=1 Tax=Paenibacillus aurantiacus TaxID=1936118 RepID=A0ABV5L0I3_9BACL